MAKSEQVQSPTVNGPATYGAMAQGQNMKGGLDLQTPEERHQSIVNWCRAEMAEIGHCTTTGEPKNPINIDSVRYMLHRKRPDDAQEITAALKVLEEEMGSKICQRFPVKADGHFSNIELVVDTLFKFKLGLGRKRANTIVSNWESQNGLAHYTTSSSATKSKTEFALINDNVNKARKFDETTTEQNTYSSSSSFPKEVQGQIIDEVFEAWVHQQFLDLGFSNMGFKGWSKLIQSMVFVRSDLEEDIIKTVAKLREPGHKYSFEDLDAIAKRKSVLRKMAEAQASQPILVNPSLTTAASGSLAFSRNAPTSPSTSATLDVSTAMKPANTTLLATKFNGVHIAKQSQVSSDDEYVTTESSQEDSELSEDDYSEDEVQKQPLGKLLYQPDYDHIDLLMPDDNILDNPDEKRSGTDAEIRHAPLVSGSLITPENRKLLPQYGFLGVTQDRSKLFLNTNIPFSAFICGVQGSGKSHSTSCLLENALIPSKHLGRLENPLSALVFSYGQFSGDGSGFSISEVASLSAAHPSFPGHSHVKKITVLVSPSNPAIARLYQKVPNVTVIPYKLKPQNLDIDIMLTLMAVNESSEQPLYMAQVTQILRDMATNGNGRLDYALFKKRLKECNFNPAQTNMLQMRMDLLESFLDLKGTCPEPSFAPGEITIMDMSCPFVDTNTACILFKIGLQRYLQSKAPGKMIVLDEAHKYMLKNPGAIALNSYLLQVIRLQRHYGARVIISTQEPTLLTDLIALCSITIIHRFSSPEWFSALKRHIPMSSQDHEKLLSDIEGLKTGTALVYSSGAVLGKNEDGTLVKGTGKMMRVGIRKRVTSDGGQSVLAV